MKTVQITIIRPDLASAKVVAFDIVTALEHAGFLFRRAEAAKVPDDTGKRKIALTFISPGGE